MGGLLCVERCTARRFGPSPHSKASRVESPFNVGSCLGLARQIGLRSSTALVSDKTLDLDKALNFRIRHWILDRQPALTNQL